jgi:large subunit ribosomal protein L9
MEIILKQDIPGLGYKDEVVVVKDGYARNYLIPKGLATGATPSIKKAHAEIIKQKAHKEEKIKNEAMELAERLKELKLTIGAKTSSKGKIFGSVNTVQVAEALKEKGYNIDRKNITFKEELIKEVGKYTALVRLHKEIQAEIPFEIIAE